MNLIYEKFEAIGNAIREKTGKTEPLTLDDMAVEISDISTGVELNFEVVGGTSTPSNPKENMIWVNTSQAITSWDFAETQPCIRSGNKNFIVYPYYSKTTTTNGITFTDLGDGTFKANGTATETSYFRASSDTAATKMFVLRPGTYSLSGCPAGGSSTTYFNQLMYMKEDGTWDNVCWEYGNGKTFTIDREVYCRLAFRVQGGVKVTNLTGYFQLEKGSVATSFVKGDATGQVWVVTGASSTVKFNALKKNGIEVYPLEVKQYVNNAWVDKVAKSWQNGEWGEWAFYLYNSGNVYSNITGGWVVNTYGSNGVAKLNSNSITLSYSNLSLSWSGAGTKQSIDLSKYSTLKFDMVLNDTSEPYGGKAVVGVTSSMVKHANITSSSNVGGTNTFLAKTAPSADGVRREVSVDISNVSSGYISIYGIMKATIYKVWLI